MDPSKGYPGTPQHQKLLQAVVSFYTDDPRIRAVIVFGSLGRGNWDRYSDLDLDIIIANGVEIDIVQELKQLCQSFAAIGEYAALIIPDGKEAGDIVLESLMELSIRYHTLETTSPNIIGSMQILSGQIDHPVVKTAGVPNIVQARSAVHILNRYVRYTLEAAIALQRGQLWIAIDLEHRTRELLMELFAQNHGAPRAVQTFQMEADARLQAKLGETLPQYNMPSVQGALIQLIDILENDLEALASGHIQLTGAQGDVLEQVRERLRSLS